MVPTAVIFRLREESAVFDDAEVAHLRTAARGHLTSQRYELRGVGEEDEIGCGAHFLAELFGLIILYGHPFT